VYVLPFRRLGLGAATHQWVGEFEVATGGGVWVAAGVTPPTPLDKAFAFVDALRARRNCVVVAPGARHWGIFKHVCESAGAKGNLIPDAYHAALATEHGCEWITTDRDYARFAGLRWRHPLD
jgi:predicted nucleic acid-binding protein